MALGFFINACPLSYAVTEQGFTQIFHFASTGLPVADLQQFSYVLKQMTTTCHSRQTLIFFRKQSAFTEEQYFRMSILHNVIAEAMMIIWTRAQHVPI